MNWSRAGPGRKQILSAVVAVLVAGCSDTEPIVTGPDVRDDDRPNPPQWVDNPVEWIERPVDPADNRDYSPAVNLGSIPGANSMEPWALNDRGEIVGQAFLTGVGERVFYYHDGKMANLGEGLATDISDTGRIVGASGRPAVVWERHGDGWRRLNLPGDLAQDLRISGAAYGVNRSGDRIVGFAILENQRQSISKATLWIERLGLWTVTALPSSDDMAEAYDLNDDVIVGSSFDRDVTARNAVVWTSDSEGTAWTMRFLPVPPGHRWSSAEAINSHAEIVGWTAGTDERPKAAYWRPTARGWSAPLLLGDLGGGISEAKAINEASQIAGTAATAGGSFHGFVWTAERGLQDLGGIAGPNSAARAINIVGIAGSADRLCCLVMWDLAGHASTSY